MRIERVSIPKSAQPIISTSSKGDQSKWRIGDKWVKQNARGYEGHAEVLATLVLSCSSLPINRYVQYFPCEIELPDGEMTKGCYSYDFRGDLQEVTLERLFEANFTSTDAITTDKTLSTAEKFQQLSAQIESFTGLNVRKELAQLFAFDALILNEDRHTNNILFLYDPKHKSWSLAPIFDNGLSLLSDEKDYAQGKPISILKRKVKAKPLNSSFAKQLSLYDGPPFINKKLLMARLEDNPLDFGRAKTVLLSQLNDPIFQKLWIEGDNDD